MKKSLIELEHDRMKWASKTFPEATALSSLEKLKEEIKEIQLDISRGIKRPEEYADAIMCLFDSAKRHGITPEEIQESYAKKIEINKNRKWVKNPDNTYSH